VTKDLPDYVFMSFCPSVLQLQICLQIYLKSYINDWLLLAQTSPSFYSTTSQLRKDKETPLQKHYSTFYLHMEQLPNR